MDAGRGLGSPVGEGNTPGLSFPMSSPRGRPEHVAGTVVSILLSSSFYPSSFGR